MGDWGGAGASPAQGGTGQAGPPQGRPLSGQCLLPKICPSLSRAVFCRESSRDDSQPGGAGPATPRSRRTTEHARGSETEEEK